MQHDAWDFWRLCDVLTIDQAANLIIGQLPGEREAMERNGAEMLPSSAQKYFTELEAATSALLGAINLGKVGVVEARTDNEFESVIKVKTEDVRKWLATRGVKSEFFFPVGLDLPDYLDSTNPRYAPKLAAAIRAWQAVTDPGKRSPKQAIDKWLREHAAEFGMVDDDGNPVNLAVEECSKIANWQPGGGATKTPGG